MPTINGITRRVSDPRTLRIQRILLAAGTRHGLEVLKYLAQHQEFTYPALREATRIPRVGCWKLIGKFLRYGVVARYHRPYHLRSHDPKFVYRPTRDGYVIVRCVEQLCQSIMVPEVGSEE